MRRRNRSPASRLTANDHSLLASAIPAAPHRGSAPSVPPGATRPSSTRAGGYREGLRPGQRDVSPGRAANRPTGDLDLQFTIPPLPDLDDPASAISPSAALLRHARGESTITSGRGSWSSPRADLENSVMLRDDQAAHQTIRKLRSEVAEEQRRADHYRAEREGLRAALSANQSQLQDLSRKMHALEEANRNLLELTQSLREQQAGATATRGGLPPHAPGTMAPRAHPSHLAPPTFHQGPSMPSASGPPFGTPPFGPPPSTFARARGPVDGRYLTGALPALFDQVETWACQFANLPNHHRDIDLPGGVRQQLTEAVEASVADTFLSRVETRWCLVTRVILQMLMVPIQDLSILKGFQPAVDRRVEQCRSQLFPQMAHHARHHVMMELCAIEKHLKQQPGYEAFWAHKTAEAVEHLFSVVGPLATVNESVNEAKQALEALAREAMRLTSLMSSMPVQWVVEFPRAGAKFTAHSMVNRDHVIGGPTRDLERRNFRVSLAITPSIVMRDVANGALLMSTLSSAHVLLLA
ncbi:MAG: hypothetical protein M1838_004257 [Thelocarpon superellum]|nr:MAG: hypothetical protein M1838_004257 [Thelocarpon superellum]